MKTVTVNKKEIKVSISDERVLRAIQNDAVPASDFASKGGKGFMKFDLTRDKKRREELGILSCYGTDHRAPKWVQAITSKRPRVGEWVYPNKRRVAAILKQL